MIIILFYFCIFRIFFDKDNQQLKSEVLMLEPVNCKVWIDRNMSADWYHSIPGLAVKGTIRAATVGVHSTRLIGFIIKYILAIFDKFLNIFKDEDE